MVRLRTGPKRAKNAPQRTGPNGAKNARQRTGPIGAERMKKYGSISSNSIRNSTRINRVVTNIKFSSFKINTMDVKMGRDARRF